MGELIDQLTLKYWSQPACRRACSWRIPAYVTDKELELLVSLAADPSLPSGSILEIGTYMGGTTIALCHGNSKRGRGELVITCDPQSTRTFDAAARCLSAMAALQEEESAVYVMGDSNMIVHMCRPRSFRMVFIDGDHSRQGAWIDLNNAARLICNRGIVVMHDVRACPGPTDIWESLDENGELRLGKTVLREVQLIGGTGILIGETCTDNDIPEETDSWLDAI